MTIDGDQSLFLSKLSIESHNNGEHNNNDIKRDINGEQVSYTLAWIKA